MTDCGEVHHFLGMKVEYNRNKDYGYHKKLK